MSHKQDHNATKRARMQETSSDSDDSDFTDGSACEPCEHHDQPIDSTGMEPVYALVQPHQSNVNAVSTLQDSAAQALGHNEVFENTSRHGNFSDPARKFARVEELETAQVLQFQLPKRKLAVIHFADTSKTDLLFASMDAALKWARLHGNEGWFRIAEISPITEDEVA